MLPTPRRRRPPKALDAIKRAGSITAQKELAPKHAWWRDQFSWRRGPPGTQQKHEDLSLESTERPHSESSHLQWARQVTSVQCGWVREQRLTQLRHPGKRRCESAPSASLSSTAGQTPRLPCAASTTGQTPRSLVLRPCVTKYGASFCIPIAADARGWVQALRGPDAVQLAEDWQQTKSHQVRKNRALMRLREWRENWRVKEAEKERLRSLSEFHEDWEDEREDELSGPGTPTIREAQDGSALSTVRSQSSRSHQTSIESGDCDLPVIRSGSRSRLSSASGISENGSDPATPNRQKAAGAAALKDVWKRSRSGSRHSMNRSSSSGSVRSEKLSPRISGRASAGSNHGVAFDDFSREGEHGGRFSRQVPARVTPDIIHYDEDPVVDTIAEEAEERNAEVQRRDLPFTGAGSDRKNFFKCKTSALLKASSFQRKAQRGVMELWEEWRTEFNNESLDSLTEFLETFPIEPTENSRVVPVVDFVQAMLRVLGCPDEITCKEVIASGILPSTVTLQTLKSTSRLDGHALTFCSISHFLSLASAVTQTTEKECTKMLWSPEDILLMEEVFKRNANCHGRLAMVSFFQVVKQLGLSELQLEDPDSQKWMSEITKTVLQGRRFAETELGSIYFEDFCRIITTALREKERQTRRKNTQLERTALRESGFSLLEMEDLRELHATYSKFGMQEDKTVNYLEDPFLRMTILLQLCVESGNLGRGDEAKLKAIVRQSPGLDRCIDGVAPFDVFMAWMKEVLEQGLADLQWIKTATVWPSSGETMAQNHSFVAAMLRECARERDARNRLSVDSSDLQQDHHVPDDASVQQPRTPATSTPRKSSTSGVSARHGSAERSPIPAQGRVSRQGSKAYASSPRSSLQPPSTGPRRCSSSSGSEPSQTRRNSTVGPAAPEASPGSRHGSLSSRHGSASSRFRGRVGSLGTQERRRSSSKADNLHPGGQSHDSPQRRKSANSLSMNSLSGDSPQRRKSANSLSSDGKAVESGSPKRDSAKVNIPKNLPPAQAMLQNKKFRACSVDLTDNPSENLPVDEADGTQQDESRRETHTSAPRDPSIDPLERRVDRSMISELPSAAAVEASPASMRHATQKSAERQMKDVQDPALILADVVSILEEQVVDKKLPSPTAATIKLSIGSLAASLEQAAADRWEQDSNEESP